MGEIFCSMLFFAMGLLIGVYGNTTVIPQTTFIKAQQYCANNQGVKEVRISDGKTTIVCKDSAEFKPAKE